MKFFIDTANLEQIREAYDLGVLDGVTTNPSLMAKEGIKGVENQRKHYVDICNIVQGDVSAEVIATDYEGMIKEGEELVGTGLGGVVPLAGSFEYSQIQSFIAKNLSSDPVAREAANIVVMNGTATAGVALTESGRLTEAGYTVSNATNAPSSDYTQTTVYRINKTEKAGTAKALAKRYGAELVTTDPGFIVADGVDFVVIIGTSSLDTNN